MPEPIHRHKMNWLLSICFVLLIALPFGGSIYGWDFYGLQSENRVMAAFPDLQNTPLDLLPEKLEAYCNDNFGFRNTFIRKHRKFEEKWFGRFPHKAIAGSQAGWWFYGPGESLDDFLGYRQFSAEELLQWEQAIEIRRKTLSEKNIPYLFMVMPDKVMVYPECAPERIRSHRSRTRFEQLQEHIQAAQNFAFIYPINELLEAKREGEVYHPGDTHWNDDGGYIGYRFLIEQLKPIYPDIIPVEKEDCTVHTSQREADIAGILTGKEILITLNRLVPPGHENINVEEDETLVGAAWNKKPRETPLHVHNPAGSGTALVIHDSFYAQGMRNLLPTHFEHTYFFNIYAGKSEFKDMTDRTNPDIVIEMRVERNLTKIPR